MNWDAIGAVAEAIAAIGVIASLIYLAFQIRASSRASAIESRIQTIRLLSDVMDGVVLNEVINDVYQRGLSNHESLSKDEYLRFSNICLKTFWYLSAAHYQFRMGVLDNGGWQECVITARFWVRSPGVQYWWKSFGRVSFGEDFQDFIDDEISRQRS